MKINFFVLLSGLFLNIFAAAAEINIDINQEFGLKSIAFYSEPEEKPYGYQWQATHKIPQDNVYFKPISFICELHWKVWLKNNGDTLETNKEYDTLETEDEMQTLIEVIQCEPWNQFKKLYLLFLSNKLPLDIAKYCCFNLAPLNNDEIDILKTIKKENYGTFGAIDTKFFKGLFFYKRYYSGNGKGDFLIVRADENWFSKFRSQIDWY